MSVPTVVTAPFNIGFYHEDRSSPSSVVSEGSDVEEDVHISCSNSEISDVNEQDGEEDIFGLLYRQADEEIVKPLDQTIGKVRASIEDSHSEDADDQSILPEFWLGFNSYTEGAEKDLSKTDSANDSHDKDHSNVIEPNIVFYK